MSYNATGNSAGRRISLLLDEGSFVEIGGAVTARNTDFNLADKGTGISELAKMLSVPLSSVMAFGDNYNDMPMLMKVGHPYLMSTSSVRDVPPNFKRTDSVVSVLKRFEESLCDV